MLEKYIVTLFENKGDSESILFECMAEDDEHAEEQVLDMYQNGDIISIDIEL